MLSVYVRKWSGFEVVSIKRETVPPQEDQEEEKEDVNKIS